MDSTPPVVIDNGTGFIKAGIAGEETPRAVFPAVVGRSKSMSAMLGNDPKQIYVGGDAVAKQGVLSLSYPLEYGIIDNWEDMTHVWDYLYHNQLRVPPELHPTMLTEPAHNPKGNRERMAEIFFEHFRVPSFYISIQANLTLSAAGMQTGLVLDAGDGVTHVIPIYEGYRIPHAVGRVNIAGRDLTNYLQKILMEIGCNFTATSSERLVVQKIKEKMCYVAQDFKEEMALFEKSKEHHKEFELPDGNKVQLGDQLIRCPEILFDPMMIGKEYLSLPKLIAKSINDCDIHTRSDLYQAIILSGGTTMIKGLAERLTKELQNPDVGSKKAKVIAPENRYYSVWIGGAVLTSLSSFSEMWISRADFEEQGPSVVHRKCL